MIKGKTTWDLSNPYDYIEYKVLLITLGLSYEGNRYSSTN